MTSVTAVAPSTSSSTQTKTKTDIDENVYYKALGLVTIQQLRRQQLAARLEAKLAGFDATQTKEAKPAESATISKQQAPTRERIQTRNNGQRTTSVLPDSMRITRRRKRAVAHAAVDSNSPATKSSTGSESACSSRSVTPCDQQLGNTPEIVKSA